MSNRGRSIMMRVLALLPALAWFGALFLALSVDVQGPNWEWLMALIFLPVHAVGGVVAFFFGRSWVLAVTAFVVPPIVLPILAFKDIGYALASAREQDQTARLQATDDVGQLLQALGDYSSRLREQAARRLRQIGPRAIEPLRDTLQAADGRKRVQAAQILRDLGWQPTTDKDRAAYQAAIGPEKIAVRSLHTSGQVFKAEVARDVREMGRTGICQNCKSEIRLNEATCCSAEWDYHHAIFYFCPRCNPKPQTRGSLFYRGQLLGSDGQHIIDQVEKGVPGQQA